MKCRRCKQSVPDLYELKLIVDDISQYTTYDLCQACINEIKDSTGLIYEE